MHKTNNDKHTPTFNKEKRWTAEALLIGFAVTFVLGIMAWVGVQAAAVPVIQQEFKTEMRHLNASLMALSEVATTSNTVMRENTRVNQEHMISLNRMIDNHEFRLDLLESKVETWDGFNKIHQD